ncbi:flagellar hook-length control protein FliK [Paracandidimonas soli]|uniref:flagellar hook-length control protein FliK n=1 Tax=Paracandidimonas soli TaxID=1917182 RepID=UPI000AF2209C
MSIGGAPSALGTLLVQRLDAVLGTTLSQQANLVSGARPDAVSQPGSPERADPVRNDTVRHPQENLNRTIGQVEHRRQAATARASSGSPASHPTATQATSSAPTTLGSAARIILELLNNYAGNAAIASRQPLVGNPHQLPNPVPSQAAQTPPPASQPMPPSPAPATAAGATTAQFQAGPPGSLAGALVQSLSQAIGNSGVFYESHLAQLLSGQRTVAELRAEPQAQLPVPQSEHQALKAASAPPPESSPGNTSPQAQPSGAHQAAQPGAMPAEIQVLVRQQLEVLANQSIAWRGEVWPDADMEWEVRRNAGQDDTASDAPDSWATKLKLELPGLGSVHARLTLAGQQIVMRIEAPESAALLSEQAGQLRARLSASGMQLSQLDITDTTDARGTAP